VGTSLQVTRVLQSDSHRGTEFRDGKKAVTKFASQLLKGEVHGVTESYAGLRRGVDPQGLYPRMISLGIILLSDNAFRVPVAGKHQCKRFNVQPPRDPVTVTATMDYYKYVPKRLIETGKPTLFW
jgi:hypothetical protein